MKIATLLIMLVLTLSQAHAEKLYPSMAGDRYPVEHWQLTMVWQDRVTAMSSPGFENYSRTSCIKEGIRRIEVDMNSNAVKWGAEPMLGFTCKYVTGEE